MRRLTIAAGLFLLALGSSNCTVRHEPAPTPATQEPTPELPGGELSKQQPHYHIQGEVPPAPILSAREELTTFKLPPGFHVELVASEPMVEKPIALTFDPDGRVYVVEMRSYMRDLAGTGELDPIGRVTLLEDTRGKGRLDKKTVFLDGLVMPRAVGLAGDGVLVAEPPNLWFCRSSKGTGVCDDKKLIFDDYGTRTANPEHIANGATWNLDNWYYNANWPARFRYLGQKFERENVASRGQWGISHDDTGRLFFNTSASMLRCDLVPSPYLSRNPFLRAPAGMNVALVPDKVFPGRVNPGVNRGYTEDLDEQGKLQRVTSSCGPVIYRGDKFPREFRGNAFVCEPAGNLVARHVLSDRGLEIAGQSVQHEGKDFLTSSDERFRPVSLYNAPDGALYIVDFYHGIIEHRAYLSAYMADQIKRRDLARGGPYGRIWRVVHDSAKPGPQPHLSKASSAQLVKNLSHPNGWWRDTCQRLLVERLEPASIALLEKTVTGRSPAGTALGRIHALWALQGMGRLRDEVASAAAKDADPRVRLASLRAGETLVLTGSGPKTIRAALQSADDADPKVRLQVLVMARPGNPALEKAARRILRASMSDPVFRHAAINQRVGEELELLGSVLGDPDFARISAGRGDFLAELAECVVRARRADRIEKLLERVAAQPRSARALQEALLRGMLAALSPDPKTKVAARPLRMQRPSAALATLLSLPDPGLVELSQQLQGAMSWPGKAGDPAPLTPLTREQAQRFVSGQGVFAKVCAVCHQPSGLGQPGTAPRLVDSDWVVGPQERLVRLVLDGLRGPARVGGKDAGLEMPSLAGLSDEQLSSVFTYVRREWGHEASPVDPETVAAIRAATRDHRGMQWTAA